MKISFKSIDDEGNEIEFRSDAVYDNDYLVFNDNEYEDTTIYVKANNQRIELLRKGQINMSLIFNLNDKGLLKYENNGLYFILTVKGKNINVNNEIISFEYDLYDDTNFVGNHKIMIKIQ